MIQCERDRRTDKQTNTQTDRQTDRLRQKERERERQRETKPSSPASEILNLTGQHMFVCFKCFQVFDLKKTRLH
jgi:hypothetical protein